MNKFLLILIVFLISCKEEKSFADDIVLSFPKDEKLTFQKFNEGIGESGSGIIYIGKDTTKIDVKYSKSMIAPPEPNPNYIISANELQREKELLKYFHPTFDRIKFSETPIDFDSFSNRNVKIEIKIQDTIPKYAYNYETGGIKKYKAFPVFIKNISGRKLCLSEFKNFPLAVLNDKNKWQTIWNDNAFICGDSRWQYRYWELNPDEIIVVSVNYLTGKSQGKFKIWTGSSSSDEFTMNYDKQIIKNQRHYFELK
ncbi:MULTISPECIES: hypothetical protein [Chryseobacterium]|uniref:hypothetical protein n=1 Tax=Chryseobacterium TaxID=59732 RepID=UPI000C9EB696|nr:MULTISPECIES: hypothetical protein [Chryseobacterium]VXC42552.1 conserved hypothetical protein [Chryseobacterium sp. 8AT]